MAPAPFRHTCLHSPNNSNDAVSHLGRPPPGTIDGAGSASGSFMNPTGAARVSEETPVSIQNPNVDSQHATGNRQHGASDSPARSVSFGVSASAFTAALFLLLRIFAVSRWDWHTASDVAATVDFGSAPTIVLGTLFAEPAIIEAFIMVVLPMVMLELVWPQSAHPESVILRLVFAAVLGAITVSLISTRGAWWLPAGAVIIFAMLVGLRMAWRRSAADRALQELLKRAGLLATIGALALAAIISTPWEARERIETTNGTIEGYVLETPSGYLKVLTADDRQLIILTGSEIVSRTIEDD